MSAGCFATSPHGTVCERQAGHMYVGQGNHVDHKGRAWVATKVEYLKEEPKMATKAMRVGVVRTNITALAKALCTAAAGHGLPCVVRMEEIVDGYTSHSGTTPKAAGLLAMRKMLALQTAVLLCNPQAMLVGYNGGRFYLAPPLGYRKRLVDSNAAVHYLGFTPLDPGNARAPMHLLCIAWLGGKEVQLWLAQGPLGLGALHRYYNAQGYTDEQLRIVAGARTDHLLGVL